MNRNTYLEKRYPLITRLEDAVKYRCWLTAKARCRDLAKLKTEYDGTEYKANYIDALNEFQIPEKLDEIK